MYSKVLKVVWIISMVAAVATFFYSYASLQDLVSFGLEGVIIGKNTFFYISLLLLALFNTTAFIFPRLVNAEILRAWYYGLVAVFHLFLCSVFILVAILNSDERYDYTSVGPMVYGSFILLMGWILAFPILRYRQSAGAQ